MIIFKKDKESMDINEFYREIGVDAKDVLNRLGSVVLIKKYLNKFAKDGTFADLKKGIAEKDYQAAFRAAHTLKGICLHLELLPLSEISVNLTDILRNYTPDRESDLNGTFESFSKVYSEIVAKLENLQ